MDKPTSPYRRRAVLAALGTVATSGVTGCLRLTGGDSTPSSGHSSEQPAATATADPTQTSKQNETTARQSHQQTTGDETVEQVFVDVRNSMNQRGATVTTTEPTLAWKHSPDVDYYSRIAQGPVISGDYLFIANSTSIITALSRTDGSVAWRFSDTAVDPYRAHRKTLALRNSEVVTVAYNRRIGSWEVLGIDPAEGRKQWSVQLSLNEAAEEHITLSKIDGNRAYVGTAVRNSNGVSKLYAVDLTKQQVAWSAPLADGNLYPEDMAIADGTAFITTDEAPDDMPNIVAFDLEARERRWDASLPIGEGIPVVDDAHVYLPVKVRDGPDSITALSRTDGSVAWRFEMRDGPRTGVTVDGNNVYTVSDNRLYALSASDGSPEWSFAAEDGPRMAGSSECLPVVTENCILTGSWPGDGGRIRAIEKASGNLAWRYDVPQGTVTSPFVADETLWAIGYNRNDETSTTLYALGSA